MAFDAVEQVFADFPFLSELPDLYDFLVDLVIADTPTASIVSQIRQTDQYRTRFAGLATRKTKGFLPITEAEYLASEASFRDQLGAVGLLNLLAPTENDFRNLSAVWIGGDVSPAEFSRRIDQGFAAVADAGEQVRAAFDQFYGYQPDDAALLLYFLDPEKGTREIENQVAAVRVGGAALEYGLNVTRTRAELLSSRGVTLEMARSGFADVARETPTLQRLATIHSVTPLSQTDLEDLYFHEDPDVLRQRQRIFQTALNEFREGSFGPGVSQFNQRGGLIELMDARRTV